MMGVARLPVRRPGRDDKLQMDIVVQPTRHRDGKHACRLCQPLLGHRGLAGCPGNILILGRVIGAARAANLVWKAFSTSPDIEITSPGGPEGLDVSGGKVGGQVGYRWQTGTWVSSVHGALTIHL